MVSHPFALGNGVQSSTISSQQPKNPKLYKTELCRSWMDHGRCNYGDRFAFSFFFFFFLKNSSTHLIFFIFLEFFCHETHPAGLKFARPVDSKFTFSMVSSFFFGLTSMNTQKMRVRMHIQVGRLNGFLFLSTD